MTIIILVLLTVIMLTLTNKADDGIIKFIGRCVGYVLALTLGILLLELILGIIVSIIL